jgi:hypothetical protein
VAGTHGAENLIQGEDVMTDTGGCDMRRIALVLFVVALRAPALAQDSAALPSPAVVGTNGDSAGSALRGVPETQTIATMPAAWLRGHVNEISLDQNPDKEDPTKIRQGAFKPTGWLAIISGDRLEGDPLRPRRLEKGFFGIRHDDDYPKDIEAFEFALILVEPGQDGDPAQQTRLRITTNYIEYNGRRVNLDAAAAAASSGDLIKSNNGRFWLHQENDGNLVQYELFEDVLCVRWSTLTGPLPKHTAMAPCNQ